MLRKIRKAFTNSIRRHGGPIELSDLLGRPSINLDTPELQRFLAGKRVLVTGAGGSIGSEICRQAMRFCPQKLLLIERSENNLFEIDRALREQWIGADIRPYLADVCDARRLKQIFDAEQPQVVFHCAAHKHVPMMELNPGEAIRNNVFGTKVAADAAKNAGAQAFVLVSTDKAVNPTSVMGATKRFAELYVQSLNQTGSKTRFVAVRFGNVLGSSGSVVPIFQKQIEAGGPVTVTHPEMQRFFMTIPEASGLVMQAGAIAKGGEVFVLDMGEPVRILDLAEELIRRNGLKACKEIAIRFTGIRPGEKLYEELACDDEQTRPTAHEKIRVWQLPRPNAQTVIEGLNRLSRAAMGSPDDAVSELCWCVPEFFPTNKPKRRESAPKPYLRLVDHENDVSIAA